MPGAAGAFSAAMPSDTIYAGSVIIILRSKDTGTMRILRFDFPREPDVKASAPSCDLKADRYLVMYPNREVLLYDLRESETPLLRIPHADGYALQASCLVVRDTEGWFSRWEREHDAWRYQGRFRLPENPDAARQFAVKFALSPSGRYLVVADRILQGGYTTLIDAVTGELKYRTSFALDARATFDVLPSGEEVLFLSAPSYMSVQMVDCRSGQAVRAYAVQSNWDFCHTHYSLSADGTRLLSFGCVWACPYETRLYAAASWTARPDSGSESPASIYLPLIFRQEEKFMGDIVLPSRFLPTSDGTFSSVALVRLEDLPLPGSEDEEGVLEGLASSEDQEIYRELCRLPRSEMAILLRRIGPATGTVAGWSLQPIATTAETRTHLLPNHRVLLLNHRVQLFDGLAGSLEDVGSLQGFPTFDTAITSDAEMLIVSCYE